MFRNDQILFNAITLLLIIAVYLAYLRASLKNIISGTGYWLIAILVYLAGLITINFQEALTENVVAWVMNDCFILSCLLLYLGTRKFTGVYKGKNLCAVLAFFAASSALLVLFALIIPNKFFRTLVYAIGTSGPVFLSAQLIIKSNDHKNLPGKMAISFMYLYIVSTVLRLAVAAFYPLDSLLEPTHIIARLSLIGVGTSSGGFAFGLALLILWKLKDRADKLAADREVLIRETHHRIKNNLAMIQSLLSIEANKYDDNSPAKQSLQDCRNRINSISNVHEMLYKQQNLDRNRLDIYLNKVSHDVFDSYDLGQVSLQFDSSPVETGTNQLVTCGLIVNELISNSCKYAFPENKNGKITVLVDAEQSAETDNQIIKIEIRDNGTGMPPELIDGTKQSFGINMIKQLVEQMSGEITFSNHAGTSCRIRIPS